MCNSSNSLIGLGDVQGFLQPQWLSLQGSLLQRACSETPALQPRRHSNPPFERDCLSFRYDHHLELHELARQEEVEHLRLLLVKHSCDKCDLIHQPISKLPVERLTLRAVAVRVSQSHPCDSSKLLYDNSKLQRLLRQVLEAVDHCDRPFILILQPARGMKSKLDSADTSD